MMPSSAVRHAPYVRLECDGGWESPPSSIRLLYEVGGNLHRCMCQS